MSKNIQCWENYSNMISWTVYSNFSLKLKYFLTHKVKFKRTQVEDYHNLIFGLHIPHIQMQSVPCSPITKSKVTLSGFSIDTTDNQELSVQCDNLMALELRKSDDRDISIISQTPPCSTCQGIKGGVLDGASSTGQPTLHGTAVLKQVRGQ